MKGKAMLIGNPCEAHAALVDCPPDRLPGLCGATVERPDVFLLAVYGADDPAGYKLVRECVNACQTCLGGSLTEKEGTGRSRFP